MSDNFKDTMQFKPEHNVETVKAIMTTVYKALLERGYDPINQLVGYILSGDPTYITSYNNARYLIRRLERDEILEELVGFYLDSISREMK
ncbi:MAG: IreB family regulatory phosphoprotein [Eubacteriales bacterium]|nr:IreB family regulatory phosphoprotein [Eubacteriales bacterium]